MSDKWNDENKTVNTAIIKEHKDRLVKSREDKNLDDIIEILLSLRVNALLISPELRTNYVDELISSDIFSIEESQSNQFVIDLLNNQN